MTGTRCLRNIRKKPSKAVCGERRESKDLEKDGGEFNDMKRRMIRMEQAMMQVAHSAALNHAKLEERMNNPERPARAVRPAPALPAIENET